MMCAAVFSESSGSQARTFLVMSCSTFIGVTPR